MGTKYWKAVCDERSIGGSGEYCGDNDAHFNRLNVLYHDPFGGKCDAGNPVNHTRGPKLGQRPLHKC
jgi:hypothetical protein